MLALLWTQTSAHCFDVAKKSLLSEIADDIRTRAGPKTRPDMHVRHDFSHVLVGGMQSGGRRNHRNHCISKAGRSFWWLYGAKIPRTEVAAQPAGDARAALLGPLRGFLQLSSIKSAVFPPTFAILFAVQAF